MLENRNNLKYCIFIFGIIVVLAISTFLLPYIIGLLAGYFLYWYISIPATIGLWFLINFILNKKKIRDAYKAFDTQPSQSKFEHQTGKKAIENNVMTGDYKAWLIEQVKPAKTKYRLKLPYKDLKGFAFIILFIVVLTAVYLWIYSLIFPNYRLGIIAERTVPGYDLFIIIGIALISGIILSYRTFKESARH